MGKGIGHGKVIILGEHFVVHHAPAIAGGIENSAKVTVKPSSKNAIVTDQKVVPEMSVAAIAEVEKSMGISGKYEVHLDGDLPTYGGLGSSAAFCVAMVRAFADEQGIHLTKEQVNKHAYDGEKAFHGNPSGLDNTMATHGGVVEYRRGKTQDESIFEPIDIKKPLHLVVSFSGKYSPTGKMVERVAKFKEDDQEEFQQLMDEYITIVTEGRKSIEKGKLDVLGSLMNENQSLLSELGVSDELNDRMIELALREGALGAKVTGGGGGGCCIALCDGNKHADSITAALKKAGFDSFPTVIEKK